MVLKAVCDACFTVSTELAPAALPGPSRSLGEPPTAPQGALPPAASQALIPAEALRFTMQLLRTHSSLPEDSV